MSAKKLYIIGNSHMDPIWLWRFREGRSTWLNTCRSVVRIMDKYPFLKFCRSSSAAYQWVEQSDPALFADIQRLVDAGRWELVGGWVEQSDVIITPAESLLRQGVYGKRYFREKFNRDIRIAYCVDSFGQNAGLPKILNASGFDRYVWMRPNDWEKKMPHLFRWRGDDATSEVTCLRILHGYCTWSGSKREDFFRSLDAHFAEGDEHQAFFFGVGDHGGGIYEQQLQWLEEYRQGHDVVYSTLDEYFNVIEKLDLPVLEGEHTHHAPGCYSAVSGVKKWMARAERNLYKAEKIVAEDPALPPAERAEIQRRFDDAWDAVLFNYFHDVYPGTSCAAAYEEEVRDALGAANRHAVDTLELALSRYGARVKTDFLIQGGVLVWNPLPYPVRARITYDTYRDPNYTDRDFDTLTDAAGNRIPLQWLRAASMCEPNGRWGRAAAVIDLEPSGLRALAFTYADTPAAPALGFERQRAWLDRLGFEVLADEGDSWGHGLRALGKTIGAATREGIEEMENGPVASRLRARYNWKNSTFFLDLLAWQGIDEIEVHIRGDWREIAETLKLTLVTEMWHRHSCLCPDVNPDATIISGQAALALTRQPDDCEQPFIDWAAVYNANRLIGFITESIHAYDSEGVAKLRLTVNRPVGYAHHDPFKPSGDEGYSDIGAFDQKLWLLNCVTDTPAATGTSVARLRLCHAEHLEITAASDGTAFHRPQWRIEPTTVDVLSQRRDENGMCFDLLNPTNTPIEFRIFENTTERLRATLPPNALATHHIPLEP